MNWIRRKIWGARPPRQVSTISTPTAKLVLHHFGTNNWTGPAGMRACQNFHMDDPSRRYHDIAYTAMVDGGAVYEGRGAGVAGAHTKGWNTKAHAVAAAVDGSNYVPDGVVDRLAEAAVHLWRQGAIANPAYTDGHRDLGASSCPGDQLYSLIPEINRRAARLAEGRTVTAKRIGGGTRHETAMLLARTKWQDRTGGVVFLVNPSTVDAAAVSNVADMGRILTVDQDTLPAETAKELGRVKPDEVVAVGGPNAVSNKVLEAARKAAQ